MPLLTLPAGSAPPVPARPHRHSLLAGWGGGGSGVGCSRTGSGPAGYRCRRSLSCRVGDVLCIGGAVGHRHAPPYAPCRQRPARTGSPTPTLVARGLGWGRVRRRVLEDWLRTGRLPLPAVAELPCRRRTVHWWRCRAPPCPSLRSLPAAPRPYRLAHTDTRCSRAGVGEGQASGARGLAPDRPVTAAGGR